MLRLREERDKIADITKMGRVSSWNFWGHSMMASRDACFIASFSVASSILQSWSRPSPNWQINKIHIWWSNDISIHVTKN